MGFNGLKAGEIFFDFIPRGGLFSGPAVRPAGQFGSSTAKVFDAFAGCDKIRSAHTSASERKPMSELEPSVTELLDAWSNGDRTALDKLMCMVDAELRRLAHYYMSRERSGHTLQTSALVNEAYLRLVNRRSVQWQNRAHFFAIAAELMRSILVDHARSHACAKRGGGAQTLLLDEALTLSQQKAAEVIALDDALKVLAVMDPQQCRIVELRFFGGLTVEETAEVLKLSPATIKRDWSTAKAWLYKELAKT